MPPGCHTRLLVNFVALFVRACLSKPLQPFGRKQKKPRQGFEPSPVGRTFSQASVYADLERQQSSLLNRHRKNERMNEK